MAPTLFQPKTQVFLAQKAPKAVILYRRSRRDTRVLLYTYANSQGRPRNSLKAGARFNGRFYPSRCDISPNGDAFLYFVMGGPQKKYDKRLYCWTAISTPPALTARFLLEHEDTWGGGGRFINDDAVLIDNGMYDDRKKSAELHGTKAGGVTVCFSDHDEDVIKRHLSQHVLDRGWRSRTGFLRDLGILNERFTRQQDRVRLVMRDRDEWMKHGDFNRWVYALTDKLHRPVLPPEVMEDVNWADFDNLGRLMMARGQYLEIYNKPRPGMKPQPDRVIDLEKEAGEE